MEVGIIHLKKTMSAQHLSKFSQISLLLLPKIMTILSEGGNGHMLFVLLDWKLLLFRSLLGFHTLFWSQFYLRKNHVPLIWSWRLLLEGIFWTSGICLCNWLRQCKPDSLTFWSLPESVVSGNQPHRPPLGLNKVSFHIPILQNYAHANKISIKHFNMREEHPRLKLAVK